MYRETDIIHQGPDDFIGFEDTQSFKQHRNRHMHTWMKLDKTIVNISSMSTDHIKNSILMLERSKQTSCKAYEGLNRELRKRIV